jgi:hypothetical protein
VRFGVVLQPLDARAARLRRPPVSPLPPDVSLPPLMPVLEPPLVPPAPALEPPLLEPPLVEPPALEPLAPDAPPDIPPEDEPAPLLRPVVPPELPAAPPDWLALEPPDMPPELPPPAPELCANTTPTAVDNIAADKTAIHFFCMGNLRSLSGTTPRFRHLATRVSLAVRRYRNTCTASAKPAKTTRRSFRSGKKYRRNKDSAPPLISVPQCGSSTDVTSRTQSSRTALGHARRNAASH